MQRQIKPDGALFLVLMTAGSASTNYVKFGGPSTELDLSVVDGLTLSKNRVKLPLLSATVVQSGRPSSI